MALMAGRLAADNKGEFNVHMTSGFLAHVKPPPQSVADVERFEYEAARQEKATIEMDGHTTTGTYEAATPLQGNTPVDAMLMLTYEADRDGLVICTKARRG